MNKIVTMGVHQTLRFLLFISSFWLISCSSSSNESDALGSGSGGFEAGAGSGGAAATGGVTGSGTGGATSTGGTSMAMGGMGAGGVTGMGGASMVMGGVTGMGGMDMGGMGVGGVTGSGGVAMDAGGVVMDASGEMRAGDASDHDAAATCQASGTLQVTNSGATAYMIDGSANPTLNLCRGSTYVFAVNASGHPFYIKTVQSTGTGNAYTSGVTGNGVTMGDLTFIVPTDAPGTLFYNCSLHSAMTGTIHILD